MSASGRNPESSRVPWGEADWTARDLAEPDYLTDIDPGDETDEERPCKYSKGFALRCEYGGPCRCEEDAC